MSNINSQPSWTSRKGKLFFWNFCIVALVAVGFYACTDNESLTGDNSISIDKPITKRSPTVTGDRVYFSDFEEFEDYYLELDTLLTTYDGDYFDSIVDLTTSVQTLNDVIAFSSVGTFGYVSDPIIRAIVNPYGEFEIDGILVSVINDRQWLFSDVSNGSLKSSIRGITRGDIMDTGDIPTGAQWAAPYDLKSAISKFWCGCRVRIEQLDCQNLRVWGACSGFFGTNGVGDIEVTFDPDGPAGPTTHIDEQVRDNFEFITDIDDFNGVAGQVHATGDSPCIGELAPSVFDFWYDPTDFVGCDWQERSIREEIPANINALERMICQTSFVKGVFSDNHVAEVWSESRTSTTDTWTKSPRAMTVRVDANRLDGECTLLASNSDSETKTKKHIVTRVVWYANCWHCDDDLIGTYQKGLLGHTQNVDFHCCEP